MRSLSGKFLFLLFILFIRNFIFRKAVKAAIFLLPLLGITHVFETFMSAGTYQN
jgi:hypothetical protein